MSPSRSNTRAVLRIIGWTVLLSVPVFVLAGIALTPLFPVPPFVAPPVVEPILAYDDLFPYYLEYVAMTRVHRRGDEPGGRHGHAAFFLAGVERVDGAPYPQLRLARAGSGRGVGVSVNKILKNVNWVAFDGADLFYNGGVGEGAVVDDAAVARVVERVTATGVFDGVEVYGDDGMTGEAMTPEGIATRSVATDAALRFGRDLACVRVPVTREMMGEIVDYLNAMNERYATNAGLDFTWDGVEDNCTHLAVNALARVGAVDPLRTDAGPVMRLFNLAIPANVFVDLARAGNDFGAPDGRDGDTLQRFGWMLGQPGVIVRFLPRFRADNRLWEDEFDMYTMERPVVPLLLIPPMQVVPIGSKWIWPPVYRFEQKAYRRLFAEPRFYDLRENLGYYLRVTEGRMPRPETAGAVTGDATYYRYLQSTRANVRAALGRH